MHSFIQALLFYIPGRLELREDTIESLLSASCLLQLSAVVQACCSFLMKQLHPSNCLGIRSYADAQGCRDLQRAAHAYTMVGPPPGPLLLRWGWSFQPFLIVMLHVRKVEGLIKKTFLSCPFSQPSPLSSLSKRLYVLLSPQLLF